MSDSNIFNLKNLKVMITGGTSGIGLAIAKEMLVQGARVHLVSNQSEDCRKAVEILADYSSRVSTSLTELGSRTAADEALKTAIDLMGGIDVLVSNAGIEGPKGALSATDEQSYLKTFDVNLHTATWLTEGVIPHLKKAGGGTIILMSSLSAFRGNQAIAAYSMTKAALSQMARNIAVSHGPDNIRCNAIAPGLIKTPFSKALMSNTEFMKKRLASTPLRRVGEDYEIAAAAVFLASRGGAFMTGQTLVIDGGTLISD